MFLSIKSKAVEGSASDVSVKGKSVATEMHKSCIELQANDPMELIFVINVTSWGGGLDSIII